MQVMKASTYILACFILYSGIARGNPAAVARRQDSQATTTLTTSSTRIELLASSTLSEPSTILNTAITGFRSASSTAPADSTADDSDVVSSKSSPTGRTSTASDTTQTITSALNGPIQTYSDATSNAAKVPPDALPLPPKITPALAVAGVFLILTGFTFTLVGVKNKWIQIFLSSAFLTSLSVTVLLVYVINPPVRPAVQGAYIAAVFITGVILGAGSLVFKEVTEGLGCLFGGFCFSMWLLALRPGGSLHSAGKLILIAVISIATYSLSFSHYTRSYGLIAATSFGGATVGVLGFDCFTRAGLKEFWLYIWNLNEKLFPLNTETYPMTRGIWVEQAVIVLIFVLGVLSQVKPWEIIKRRRDSKAAICLGNDRKRDHMEEEMGGSFQEDIEREEKQWESVRGCQGGSGRDANTDSGLEIQESNNVLNISASYKEAGEGQTSTRVILMDDINLIATEQATFGDAKAFANTRSIMGDGLEPKGSASGPVAAERAVAVVTDSDANGKIFAGLGEGNVRLLQPAIIPLPFSTPSTEIPQTSVNGSVFGLAGSETGFTVDPKRWTGEEDEQIFWGNEGGLESAVHADHAFPMPHATNNEASSLAATIDDDFDEHRHLGHWRKARNHAESESSREAAGLPDDVSSRSVEASQQKKGGKASESLDELTWLPTLSAADDSDPEELQRCANMDSELKRAKPESLAYADKNEVEAITGPVYSRSGAPEAESEGSQVQASISKPHEALSSDTVSRTRFLRKGALDQVPSQLFHVMTSYRTNEWAKHISTAVEPEFDEPENILESAHNETPARLIERPAADDVEELQQNALGTTNSLTVSPQQSFEIPIQQPTDLNRNISGKCCASNSYAPSSHGKWDSTTHLNILPQLSSGGRQTDAPAAGLSMYTSAISQSHLPDARAPRRSSSTAPRQTLTISPIDENVEAEFLLPSEPSIPHSPIADSAERDSLLRNRHSQLTTRNPPSPAEMISWQQPTQCPSCFNLMEGPSSNVDDIEPRLPMYSAKRLSAQIEIDEDISLSLRKAMLQQQSATLLPATLPNLTKSVDTHLPQSLSSAMTARKRESMLFSWRESMRQDIALSSASQDAVGARRAQMLMEKQQLRMHQQHSEATKRYREKAFDQAMMRSDMQELHRKALRKMQAYANMHVS